MSRPVSDAKTDTVPWRVGGWGAVTSIVALGLAGTVGLVLAQPWIFPSLGPTIMVLAETPRQAAARPRNVLIGHLVGIGAGYLALLCTGMTQAPPVIEQGITAPRIVAACLSLAVTAFVLQVLRTPHPPAGATTLLVSLGILTAATELLTVMLSVALITVVVVGMNRIVGVRQAGVGNPDGQ